jgi:hypothetical protein
MPRRRVAVRPDKLSHTKITPRLMEWGPWEMMSPTARCLWIGLYASPEARSVAPGLWRGGVAVMAESSCLGVTDTQNALSELKERGVLLFDPATRVAIFTRLPDRAMRPANGRCIVRYYKRWAELPDCLLVDAWIHLLLWLCHPMTGDHEKHWDSTFGDATGVMSSTIPIFPIEGVITNSEKPVVLASTNGHDEASRGEPEDKVAQTSMFQQGSDTVSETVEDTLLITYSLSGVREGGVGEERTRGPANGADFLEGRRRKPRRKPERPFAIKDLFAALRETSAGRVATTPWDVRMAKPLWDVIEACGQAEVTLEDVRLAGDWLAAGGLGYRDDLGIPWIAKTGELLNAVAKARLWGEAGRGKVESHKKGSGRGVTARDLADRAASLEADGQ